MGLLDISKPGRRVLNRVAERLAGLGAEGSRYAKPTFAKPALPTCAHEISARCDAVIEALAD